MPFATAPDVPFAQRVCELLYQLPRIRGTEVASPGSVEFASHGSIHNVIVKEWSAGTFPPQFSSTGGCNGRGSPGGRASSAGRRRPTSRGVRSDRQGTRLQRRCRQGRQDQVPRLQARRSLRHVQLLSGQGERRLCALSDFPRQGRGSQGLVCLAQPEGLTRKRRISNRERPGRATARQIVAAWPSRSDPLAGSRRALRQPP